MARLAAQDLSIGFPGQVLARGIQCAFEPGNCWAVLGNNGSGKSTLLQVLAGVRAPLAGSVELDGRDCRRYPAAARARLVGLLQQEEPEPFWGTVREYVLLGRHPHRGLWPGWSAHDESVAQAAIEAMDLGARADRRLATCSGGERQRARLALVLAQDPAVCLLDEPLLHLDLRHQMEVMARFRQLAAQRGKTVIMVLHDPGRARVFCDHGLLLFDDGTVQAGPAPALFDRNRLEGLYRCPVS